MRKLHRKKIDLIIKKIDKEILLFFLESIYFKNQLCEA